MTEKAGTGGLGTPRFVEGLLPGGSSPKNLSGEQRKEKTECLGNVRCILCRSGGFPQWQDMLCLRYGGRNGLSFRDDATTFCTVFPCSYQVIQKSEQTKHPDLSPAENKSG